MIWCVPDSFSLSYVAIALVLYAYRSNTFLLQVLPMNTGAEAVETVCTHSLRNQTFYLLPVRLYTDAKFLFTNITNRR